MAGIIAGQEFPAEELALEPGDRLVFTTDGITEAFSERDEIFTEERVERHLAVEPARDPAGIVDGLLGAVRRHVGGRDQSDDLTVVAIRYAP